ncbi:MAG: tetratricopeptide repeat protein [Xanthobacteraceae bacterium]
MTTSRLRRTAVAAVVGAAVVAAPLTISAQAPTAQDLAHATASGSYLAARHAGQMRDAAAAAAYYRAAIRRDPKNTELIERAFLSLLIGGDVAEAVKLADRVLKLDKNDRVARLVAGVRIIKQKQ